MWINCLHLSPFHHLLFSFPPTAVQLSSLSFPFNCLYQSYYHSLSCQGQWCVIISGEPSAAVFITADLFSPSKNTFFSWLPQHHTFLSFAFLFQLTERFFLLCLSGSSSFKVDVPQGLVFTSLSILSLLSEPGPVTLNIIYMLMTLNFP